MYLFLDMKKKRATSIDVILIFFFKSYITDKCFKKYLKYFLKVINLFKL